MTRPKKTAWSDLIFLFWLLGVFFDLLAFPEPSTSQFQESLQTLTPEIGYWKYQKKQKTTQQSKQNKKTQKNWGAHLDDAAQKDSLARPQFFLFFFLKKKIVGFSGISGDFQ